jgi:N-formylglutamate amidohydrolase
VYFSVAKPKSDATPVVVEVPHAGLMVDPLSLATLAAPARSLGRDADLYVDELYAEAPRLGASLLVAHVSRYVCDLNRGERDVDARAAEGGTAVSAPHGLVWRTTTEDRPALLAPLTRRELGRRIDDIYRPYHNALVELLEDKLRHFGYAILLCAHSMPSWGRAGHSDPGRPRADIVPGSRGGTTAALAIRREVENSATEHGWTVRHDDPYKGGFSTGHYGRPEKGCHAIQVEIARKLYMDEQTLQKTPGGFEKTQQFCSQLVRRLGTLQLT